MKTHLLRSGHFRHQLTSPIEFTLQHKRDPILIWQWTKSMGNQVLPTLIMRVSNWEWAFNPLRDLLSRYSNRLTRKSVTQYIKLSDLIVNLLKNQPVDIIWGRHATSDQLNKPKEIKYLQHAILLLYFSSNLPQRKKQNVNCRRHMKTPKVAATTEYSTTQMRSKRIFHLKFMRPFWDT